MELVYFLLPAAILLGALGLAAFVWALRSGQFNDLDTPARRILLEDLEHDDDPNLNSNKTGSR